MSLYSESHAHLNITAAATVLTYVLPGPTSKLLVCRTILVPVVGNGNYLVRVYLNDMIIAPTSVVTVESIFTEVTLQSREISLEPGDEIRVAVLGRDGDTDVSAVATLIDHTPITKAEVYGAGSVPVDHNFGSTDALAYVTSGGHGIDNATVQAFMHSDWVAGRRGTNYIQGSTLTNIRGRWLTPLMLDPERYILLFFRQGSYGPNTADITVE